MERWHLSWVTAKELYTRRPLFFSSVVVQGGEKRKEVIQSSTTVLPPQWRIPVARGLVSGGSS